MPVKQWSTPRTFPAALLAQNRERVVVGLARVDDDRAPELAGEPDLRAEHGVLHVAWRKVVVVVEADFADRPRRRRRVELRPDHGGRLLGIVGELVRLVRVDADRKPRLGPELLDACAACAASFALPASRIDQ